MASFSSHFCLHSELLTNLSSNLLKDQMHTKCFRVRKRETVRESTQACGCDKCSLRVFLFSSREKEGVGWGRNDYKHVFSYFLHDRTRPTNYLPTFLCSRNQDSCLGCWLSISGPQLKCWISSALKTFTCGGSHASAPSALLM